VPTYQYDYVRYHLLRDYGIEPLRWGEATRRGYPLMLAYRSALERQKNFLWLADAQSDKSENLYVDEFHYTAAFAAEIANRISAFMQVSGLLVDLSERGIPRSAATSSRPFFDAQDSKKPIAH